MRYPAYPEYRDSGVQWLGRLPGHWEVKRLKFLATINDDALPETTDPDFEFSYVDIGSVSPIEGITSTESMIFENSPSRARRKVAPGDSIVSTVRTYLRAIAPIPEISDPLVVSTGFAVVRPRKVKSTFLAYALRDAYFVESIVARSVGVSYPAVNASEIGDIAIPLPSEDEQTAIADFLDRETGRVDTLVAKKRRLIALLREKRSALISRTVTRGFPDAAAREFGLEPHTRFKDSGIEWLGEVPEGWGRARKLTHFALREKNSFVNGPFGSDLLTSEITEEGVPVIYIRDISSGKYRRKSEGHVTEEKAAELRFCNVLPGDILIAKVGDPPGTAVVYPEGEPHAIVTQDVIRLRVDRRKVSPGYLAYFLNSSAGRGLIDQVAIESTRMRVGLGDYKGSLAVFPPTAEQTAIATYLDRETARIDRLVEKVEAAIDRLQEYRTALITAAVTGKIDVQEIAA